MRWRTTGSSLGLRPSAAESARTRIVGGVSLTISTVAECAVSSIDCGTIDAMAVCMTVAFCRRLLRGVFCCLSMGRCTTSHDQKEREKDGPRIQHRYFQFQISKSGSTRHREQGES